MNSGVAVVGAAETTELGVIPNLSQQQLHAAAALNAWADGGGGAEMCEDGIGMGIPYVRYTHRNTRDGFRSSILYRNRSGRHYCRN